MVDVTADVEAHWAEWCAKRNAWVARNRAMASRPGGLYDLNTEQLRAFGTECMDMLREARELLRMGGGND